MKVFAPVKVCAHVETTQRAVVEASTILNVCVFPDDTILKSFPIFPIAKT